VVRDNLDSRPNGQRFEYYVDWEDGDQTWEPMANVRHLTAYLDDFHRASPNKPKPRSRLNRENNTEARRRIEHNAA